jgi:hypothetical protein
VTIEITEGSFLPGGGTTFFIPGIIDNVGGGVCAAADSLIGAISGVTGDGTLAEFQLTTLAAGTSALSLANSILLDSSLNDITADNTIQNRSVTNRRTFLAARADGICPAGYHPASVNYEAPCIPS